MLKTRAVGTMFNSHKLYLPGSLLGVVGGSGVLKGSKVTPGGGLGVVVRGALIRMSAAGEEASWLQKVTITTELLKYRLC